MNYFDNPRRQVGFILDMHRILEKYSLTFALQDFMEDGRFLSKYSWKRLLKERMSSQCRNELLLKANEVQVGKDQEKAQSEKDSLSKNRGGKKTKLTIRHLYHETYRKPNEQLFSKKVATQLP